MEQAFFTSPRLAQAERLLINNTFGEIELLKGQVLVVGCEDGLSHLWTVIVIIIKAA